MGTNKRKLGKKVRFLRSSVGILLAAAVILNMMSLGGIAVSASEGTGNGLCEHHPEHDESCTFVSEICSSETPEDDREENDIETGTSEPETGEETKEADSVQTETAEETESGIQETDRGQTEIEEPADVFVMDDLELADVLTVYVLEEETETREAEIGNRG